jgi:hypothetical protein
MMTRFTGAIGLRVVVGAVPPELDVGFPDPAELVPEELEPLEAAELPLEEVAFFAPGSGVKGLCGVLVCWWEPLVVSATAWLGAGAWLMARAPVAPLAPDDALLEVGGVELVEERAPRTA